VYDRITIFEDHLVRDINAGRFGSSTSLVLITHGLALRIFLMRWLHWTVDQFLEVYNPPNAEVCVCVWVRGEVRGGGAVAWLPGLGARSGWGSERWLCAGCPGWGAVLAPVSAQ
jgi:broad specificity phosphatase PhoE